MKSVQKTLNLSISILNLPYPLKNYKSDLNFILLKLLIDLGYDVF